MSTDDFKGRFAQRFGLKNSADCERVVLSKTRYPVARVMAPVIEVFWPSLSRQDRELVAKIVSQNSIDGVRSLVDFFKAQQSYESSFLRGALRLRVSGRRVMALANEVFAGGQATSQTRAPDSPPKAESISGAAAPVTPNPKGRQGNGGGAKKVTPGESKRVPGRSSKPA